VNTAEIQGDEKMKERIQQCKFLHHLNIKLHQVCDGVVEASVPLQPSYMQHQQAAHGGLITTLADSAAGFAAISMTPHDREVVTVELKISFLKAARGASLVAKGKVIKSGRQFHFCEAEVWSDAILVAKASATMAVVQIEQP